jgi:hypothetical protein
VTPPAVAGGHALIESSSEFVAAPVGELDGHRALPDGADEAISGAVVPDVIARCGSAR